MTIFERVRELNFPDGHYIVVGSGIMAAKGIREAGDLDFVISPELFETLVQEGWEIKPWTKKEVPGDPWLKSGGAEATINLHHLGEILTHKGLLEESERIEGIPFITLERLKEFKREYGRPKDFDDISLIEKYLALETEGYKHIFVWHDTPGITYTAHAHKDKVAMYILNGSLIFQFSDETVEFKKGDRFDVPVGKKHTAVVGASGCDYLVGEMI